VVVVHGVGEHSGRYADFAAPLVAAGFRVAAFDLRGHGE
jgi:alpha-beta hydrolase superfamily lysophospholipase